MIDSTADGGVIIDIRVIPRASRSGPVGFRDGALLVRLHAAPVEGAANTELIEILASTFDVPKRNVSIVAGRHSRHKRVRISGIDAANIKSRLGPCVEP